MNATAPSFPDAATHIGIVRGAAVTALEAMEDGDVGYAHVVLESVVYDDGSNRLWPGAVAPREEEPLPPAPHGPAAATISRRLAARYADLAAERRAA